MLTYGMGGSVGGTCKFADLRWVLKKRKLRFKISVAKDCTK